MQCNHARIALDTAFDEGAPLDATLTAHVLDCVECRAHQNALESLDRRIREVPALMHDAALVARIQARIAAQPPARASHWEPVGALVAALLLIAGLGWFIDPMEMTPILSAQAWMPQEPLLPEWTYVKQEIMHLPAAMNDDVQEILHGASRVWGGTTHWSAKVFGTSGPMVWVAFFTCLAIAVAINSLEWTSRQR